MEDGPAPLGYGDDPLTEVLYGEDADEKHTTTYFRTAFDLEEGHLLAKLFVRLRRDDGAVVYLNGEEIVRDNLPSEDPLGFQTWAAASVGAADELAFHEFPVPLAALRANRNVLAVEVHQSGPTSSDLILDLELSALANPPAAAFVQLEEAQRAYRQEALRLLKNPPPEAAKSLADFYDATRTPSKIE